MISWRWVTIVVGAAICSALILLLATLSRPPAVSMQPIQSQVVVDDPDVSVRVFYEKQLSPEWGAEAISSITLVVTPRVLVSHLDANLLAPNGTLINTLGDPQITTTDSTRKWTWGIVAKHNGKITSSNEDLLLDVNYSVDHLDGPPESGEKQVPFSQLVVMQDFPAPFYIAMIAVGIITSYLFADGGKIVPRVVQQFGEIRRPVIWIALSLVLTPIVYTQFKQTVGTLADQQAIIALLLAVPFGAGLDFGLTKAADARS
jgi:hypothetical protein